MEGSVRLENLSHAFGRQTVLNNFNLHIPAATLAAIKGGNGSGKTTVLKTISTLLDPSAGEVFVCGFSARSYPRKVRELVSCAFVNTRGLFPNLKVRENLYLWGKMFRMRDSAIKEALLALDPLVDGRLDLYPHQLSTGMRQSVQLTKALMRPARVILLDEPYLALDEWRIQALNGILRERQNNGHTILIAIQELQAAWLPTGTSIHPLNTKSAEVSP